MAMVATSATVATEATVVTVATVATVATVVEIDLLAVRVVIISAMLTTALLQLLFSVRTLERYSCVDHRFVSACHVLLLAIPWDFYLAVVTGIGRFKHSMLTRVLLSRASPTTTGQ